MQRRAAGLTLALSFLSTGPLLASHPDGMLLLVSHGPGPGEVALQWTGGQPDFTLYRSTDKTLVISPGNVIGVSPVRSWVDDPPPGAVFFYEITSPCVYAPPEVCDGVDNDCDGETDEGAGCPGTPCTLATECASGFCTDGVCCQSACAGPCVACNLQLPGVCSGHPVGTDPENGCSGFLCDGSGACRTTCASDPDCAATHVCETDGTCRPRCLSDADCSGYACRADQHCQPSCAADADCAAGYFCDVGREQCLNANLFAARVGQGGGLLGTDIPIAVAPYHQRAPAIAFDGTNYLVAWVDTRDNPAGDVFIARYGPDGVAIGPGPVSVPSNPHSVACGYSFGGGNYLVVWSEGIAGSRDIRGVRVTPMGAVLDDPPIPIATGVEDDREPAVASDGASFLVVWSRSGGPSPGIYAARLTDTGMVLDGGGILVGADPLPDQSWTVAWGGGNYLVAWSEGSAGSRDIRGARVSPMGAVLDDPPIPIATGLEDDREPVVAADGASFLVAWTRSGGPSPGIYAARLSDTGMVLDAGGIPVGVGPGPIGSPAVGFGGGNYLVVWSEGIAGSRDIRAARLNPGSGAVLDAPAIPISVGSADESDPTVASDGTGYLVVWEDYRPVPTGARTAGGACALNADCASGHCTDGVCCNSACNLPNAAGSCTNGTCALLSCNPGWGNCDGVAANGCETSLDAIPNCGSCGQTCNDGGACTVDACVAGACTNIDQRACRAAPTSGAGGLGCSTMPAPAGCWGTGCTGGTVPLPAGCGQPDGDGDGLPDAWETNHAIDGNCDGSFTDLGPGGLDLVLPDDPDWDEAAQPNLYVTYDYMERAGSGEAQHEPVPDFIGKDYDGVTDAPVKGALTRVKEAFALKGIRLKIEPNTNPASINPLNPTGITSPLPHYDVVTFAASPGACATNSGANTAVSFYAVKSQNFDARRRFTHRYLVFAHSVHCQGNCSSSECVAEGSTLGLCAPVKEGTTGLAEIEGEDILVTLGGQALDDCPTCAEPTKTAVLDRLLRFQAGTAMHEIGHTFGLDHGGANEPGGTCAPNPQNTINRKPNYISVMQYALQTTGIRTSETTCSTTPVLPVPSYAQLDPGDWRVDYSSAAPPELSEIGLVETFGMQACACGVAGGARDISLAYRDCDPGAAPIPACGGVDWNRVDGVLGTVAVDINQDRLDQTGVPCPSLGNLAGFDDWSHVGASMAFQCGANFADGAPSHQFPATQEAHEQLLVDMGLKGGSPILVEDIELQAGVPNVIPLLGTFIVAVMGSSDFDVSSINPSSLRFAGAAPLDSTVSDADGDGYLDLNARFRSADTTLTLSSTTAMLTGVLNSSRSIYGSASFTVVWYTSCDPGFGDCDGNPANGCETDIGANPDHCGLCSQACSGNNIASRTCASGTCDGTCVTGYLDCNGDKRSDGCEVNSVLDASHCGSCGTTCDDLSACTNDLCVASACRNVDRSRCAVAVCDFAQSYPGCANTDTDGDGLSDTWEDARAIDLDCNGVYDSNDVTIPDANRLVADVYVKASWMTNSPTETIPDAHKPTQESIERVVAAFDGSHLVTSPIECGPISPACPPGSVCPTAGFSVCLSVCATDADCATGRCVDGMCRLRRLHLDYAAINPIPHRQVVSYGPVQAGCLTGGDAAQGVNFYDLKADPANFDPKTALFKRYAVFGHLTHCDSAATCASPACPDIGGFRPVFGASGLAEIHGNDFIVTLGGYPEPATLEQRVRRESGTFMHELGHNLGLRHGGPDCDPMDPACDYDPDLSRKVNYLSVMNHMYNFGIVATNQAGSVTPDPLRTRPDFSHAALPPLDEAGLNEPLGLQPGNPPPYETDLVRYFNPQRDNLTRYGSTAPGRAIDWNAADPVQPLPVSVDINTNTIDEAYAGADDWRSLDLPPFQCAPLFVDNIVVQPGWLAADEIDPVIALATDQLLPGVGVRLDVQSECLDINSNGVIPAVVYGSATFDVQAINLTTLRLAEAMPVSTESIDEDFDGYLDLGGRFLLSDMVLSPDIVAVVLLGKRTFGQSFQGEDTVGCATGLTCVDGVCCPGGWVLCNSACVDPGADPDNCGGCGMACSGNNVATRICTSGVCNGPCNPGFGDCNADKRTDGCETDLDSDSDSCGGCGFVCSNNNMATRTCSSGMCNGTCATGFADCNANKLADGCEVNLNGDPNSCGGCGLVCSSNHITTPTCTSGTCTGACDTGWADCDGNKQSNGCETSLTTSPDNCGGCGLVCSSNHITTPTCTGGTCTGACDTGWADCNGNKLADGCETSLNSDPGNCGGCGLVCSSNHITTPMCSGGSCTGACDSGWADCNGNKLTDGCETNLNSDPGSCGGCGLVCSSNHITTPTCTGGTCSGACDTGWADCDGNKQSNGCETSLTTSPDSCGGCGLVCSANNMATRTCSAGVCNGTCATGFADCNGNKQTDGCEVNLNSDRNSCGGCFQACAPAGDACQGGVCQCGAGPTCDTLFCTLGATCGGGACAGGLPRDCGTGLACAIGVCNEATDTCDQRCTTAPCWTAPLGTGTASAPASDSAFAAGGASRSYVAQGMTLYAVRNLAVGPDPAGSIVWSATPSPSPTIVSFPAPVALSNGAPDNEFIFVTATDGFVYKIDADTGATAALADTRRAECAADSLWAAPSVQLYQYSDSGFQVWVDGQPGHAGDDVVFVVTRTGCGDTTRNRVIAYWASDLTPAWAFNDPPTRMMDYGSEGCALDYATNMIFCGTNLAAGRNQNTLWAINTAGGALVWSANAGSIQNRPRLANPAALGPRLYVASRDGSVRAYNPDGDGAGGAQPYWITPATVPDPVTAWADMTTDGGGWTAIFVGANGLRRIADTGPSGIRIWEIQPPGFSFTGTPVIYPSLGKVYIGRTDGMMQQLDLASGAVEKTVPVAPPGTLVFDPTLDVEGGAADINRLTLAIDPVAGQLRRYCAPWVPDSQGLACATAADCSAWSGPCASGQCAAGRGVCYGNPFAEGIVCSGGPACGQIKACRSGSCVANDYTSCPCVNEGDPACGSGQTCCGFVSGCRFLFHDPNNCGACGRACEPGQKCLGGACQRDADACLAPDAGLLNALGPVLAGADGIAFDRTVLNECSAYLSTFAYPLPSAVKKVTAGGTVTSAQSTSPDQAPLHGVDVAREGDPVFATMVNRPPLQFPTTTPGMVAGAPASGTLNVAAIASPTSAGGPFADPRLNQGPVGPVLDHKQYALDPGQPHLYYGNWFTNGGLHRLSPACPTCPWVAEPVINFSNPAGERITAIAFTDRRSAHVTPVPAYHRYLVIAHGTTLSVVDIEGAPIPDDQKDIDLAVQPIPDDNRPIAAILSLSADPLYGDVYVEVKGTGAGTTTWLLVLRSDDHSLRTLRQAQVDLRVSPLVPASFTDEGRLGLSPGSLVRLVPNLNPGFAPTFASHLPCP